MPLSTPEKRAGALIEALQQQGTRFDHVADSLDGNTKAVGRLPTKTQFAAGILVVIAALVLAFWSLNHASQQRSKANKQFTVTQQAITRKTIVATIQCLAAGVLPDGLNDCVEGIVTEGNAPPAALPQNQPSTTTTTATIVPPAALGPPTALGLPRTRATTTTTTPSRAPSAVPSVGAGGTTTTSSTTTTVACMRLAKLPGCFLPPLMPVP